MTKTFNKIKVGIGLAALATLFVFNLHHAVVYHYGVLNLNFSQHPQIYAQTNSAGWGPCLCGAFTNGCNAGCFETCPARCNCGGFSTGFHTSWCPLYNPGHGIPSRVCHQRATQNQAGAEFSHAILCDTVTDILSACRDFFRQWHFPNQTSRCIPPGGST